MPRLLSSITKARSATDTATVATPPAHQHLTADTEDDGTVPPPRLYGGITGDGDNSEFEAAVQSLLQSTIPKRTR